MTLSITRVHTCSPARWKRPPEDAAIVLSDRLRQQIQGNMAARTNVTLGYPRLRRQQGTLHPDQRALHLAELAEADAVNGYSFILTKGADRPG